LDIDVDQALIHCSCKLCQGLIIHADETNIHVLFNLYDHPLIEILVPVLIHMMLITSDSCIDDTGTSLAGTKENGSGTVSADCVVITKFVLSPPIVNVTFLLVL
jgi:hypothetical protein